MDPRTVLSLSLFALCLFLSMLVAIYRLTDRDAVAQAMSFVALFFWSVLVSFLFNWITDSEE